MRGWRRWLLGQAALWAIGAAVLRAAVVPAESCPPVVTPDLDRAIAAAAGWLVRGQREDGRFLYGYAADTGELSSDYNTTRHAGVLDALYRARRVGAADEALGYVLENLVDHGRWTAFAPAGEDANVGANALLAAALVHRRQATGDARHDELARRIARFLVEQTRADGSVLKYWRPSTRAPVPGVFGTYSTGEAFWALALLHRAFPAEGWQRPAHRIGDYLATRRDLVEGHAVHQADHWAAYGLAELAPEGLSGAEAAYARRLAGYFGFLTRLELQRTGSALNPIWESGSRLGTIGEALAALGRVAEADRRLAGDREALGERLTCLAGILVERQSEAADPRARGAWFAAGSTRMDDQQHGIAALLGAREAVR